MLFYIKVLSITFIANLIEVLKILPAHYKKHGKLKRGINQKGFCFYLRHLVYSSNLFRVFQMFRGLIS